MVPKKSGHSLPLFASTIATPVLRREASIASTRISPNVKIYYGAFNMESTNSNATVLLPPLSSGDDETQNRQRVCCHHRDDVRDTCERVVILRHDKRLKPNRHAGFATGRRPLDEFSNPRQADCESVSIASRAGPDRLGRGSGVSRISARRMDLRHGDRVVEKRALSPFDWVCELVPSPGCRSSAVYRSWVLGRTSQNRDRSHSCRLQERSNPRLRLRL